MNIFPLPTTHRFGGDTLLVLPSSCGLHCIESSLGAGDVLLNRAATYANTTDYFVSDLNRQATTENGDAGNVGHAGEQRRVILDEVVKILRGHAKERSVGLVLRHFDTH